MVGSDYRAVVVGYHLVLRTLSRNGQLYGRGLDGVGDALLAVETEPAEIEARFETVKPSTCSQVTGFKQLLSVLQTEIGPRDVVVCLSARRGEIGWHRELQTLRKRISTLVEGNVAMVYPLMTGIDDDRRFRKLRDE